MTSAKRPGRQRVPVDRKVFVFGIDSVDPDILLRLAKEGRMPALRSVLDDGVWARTEDEPYMSESPWPNFFTAVNPARHGRYFHSQIVPGSYRTALFHPRDLKAPPYWCRLSEAGKRVVVVDVPKTHVTGPLNGIQIVDWGLHDQEIMDAPSSWPADLAGQLDGRFGDDPVGANDFGGNGPRDFGAYREACIANVERKTRLVTALMTSMDWDHFLVVFDDTHHVGHYAWHLHDLQHPDHDPELRRGCGDPLETVCLALDKAIAEILANLDPDCVFAILVSHGIGPNYHASYVLDMVLRRLEGARTGAGRTVNPLRSLWRSMPVSLNRLLVPIQNTARNMLLGRDRRARKAFTLPAADDTGSIRVNLAGREPNGLIRPGADFEGFCAELEQRLLDLRNIDTGEPVVDRVVHVRDMCVGPYVDHLPDLIVHWDRRAPIRGVTSPDVGELRMPAVNSRKGSHSPDGLILVRDGGASAGPLPGHVRLMDIAPTVCTWMGMGLDDVDGRPIPGLGSI